jgi:hypothetical protein
MTESDEEEEEAELLDSFGLKLSRLIVAGFRTGTLR